LNSIVGRKFFLVEFIFLIIINIFVYYILYIIHVSFTMKRKNCENENERKEEKKYVKKGKNFC
jgi:dolichyl-phosphate-mannose--protein O-mannosyl transferase